MPKGVPLRRGERHLAVHVEDHPLEYATFEGEIPKGEYGGGRMFIWDRGHYETLKWSDREVAVIFSGERAQGRYTFFRSGKDRLFFFFDYEGRRDDSENSVARVVPLQNFREGRVAYYNNAPGCEAIPISNIIPVPRTSSAACSTVRASAPAEDRSSWVMDGHFSECELVGRPSFEKTIFRIPTSGLPCSHDERVAFHPDSPPAPGDPGARSGGTCQAGLRAALHRPHGDDPLEPREGLARR